MNLTIGYFYKDQLNLYGDNGNVEILVYRAKKRDIKTDVIEIGLGIAIDKDLMKNINLVFMGGGPDSEQRIIYDDLIKNKGYYLKENIKTTSRRM